MNKYAILARLEAKAGKEAELEAFLKSALPLAPAEPGTNIWFALKIGPSTFGIFDTFSAMKPDAKPTWTAPLPPH